MTGQALYWEVPGFKRSPGRPHTNWRSTGNKDLLMGINREEVEVAAQNRSEWCRSVANASTWIRLINGQGLGHYDCLTIQFS